MANNNPQGNNKQDNSLSTSMASKGRIMTIIGGNSIDHENNNQKKNYFRRVNSISTEGPYKKTRWSHLPITFLEKDLQLKDYPHMDAIVVEANIDGWAVSKILVDGGSSADIIFTATIDDIKIDRKLLGRAEHPLYGFGGKPIHSIGRIVLPVSFGTVNNARIEQIAFDVVDIHYPYNALFGRGTLNAFEAVISYSYLCMKIPTINGVITVHGDQPKQETLKKNTLLVGKMFIQSRKKRKKKQKI
jgi:hypothetical protein